MKNKNVLLFSLMSLFSGTLIAQQNWKTTGNNLTTIGKLGTTSNQDVQFISNNKVNGVLSKTGFWGFGTTDPSAKLHINSASGEDALRVQVNGGTKLKITADGGVSVGGSPSAPINGLSVFGSLGVGTTNTENFKVKIVHSNNLLNGLAIENANNPGIEWSLFTGAGNSPLNFIRDGALLGQISFPSGQYLALSDERLKTNIRPMASVLDKINRLKPSSYQFKNTKSNSDCDGFIAQEVIKIFPSLVQHTVDSEAKLDVYTMDYSGFGVIAIKGIQELMKQNDSLKSEVQDLKSEMMQIKSTLNIGSQSTGAGAGKLNVLLTNASLGQNVPNPFPNSTMISYNLPQKFSKANMLIADRSGKTIKQINLTVAGEGRVNVDASALLPGTYNYSLIVDGRVIDSKQMAIAK